MIEGFGAIGFGAVCGWLNAGTQVRLRGAVPLRSAETVIALAGASAVAVWVVDASAVAWTVAGFVASEGVAAAVRAGLGKYVIASEDGRTQ